MIASPPVPCLDLPAIPVSFGSEQWCWLCGCGHRTPVVSDRATALQALNEHRRKKTT